MKGRLIAPGTWPCMYLSETVSRNKKDSFISTVNFLLLIKHFMLVNKVSLVQCMECLKGQKFRVYYKLLKCTDEFLKGNHYFVAIRNKRILFPWSNVNEKHFVLLFLFAFLVGFVTLIVVTIVTDHVLLQSTQRDHIMTGHLRTGFCLQLL